MSLTTAPSHATVFPGALPLMISYAQNNEDVLLRRVLHDVSNGFYVDVGAQEPKFDSVTKHFYDAGWRGINIEPHPTYFAAILRERTRDINLNLAVSDRAGTADFHFVENSGLSSLNSDALRVANQYGLKTRSGRVPTEKLSALLLDHSVGEIHFLKIDVEGAEAAVLRSMDFKRWRPWVVLIEATLPNDPTPCWDEFEPLMIAGGYQAVYFDGLNRWYLRDESMERASLFSVPVNVFDRYVRWKEHEWNEQTNQKKAPPATQTSFGAMFRK
jgi:FkbM family methyltransferase